MVEVSQPVATIRNHTQLYGRQVEFLQEGEETLHYNGQVTCPEIILSLNVYWGSPF